MALRSKCAIALVATVVLLAGSVPASASKPAPDVEGISGVVDTVAPETVIAPEVTDAGEFIAVSEQAQVTMPTDGTGDVVIEGAHGELSIGLPDETARADAGVAENGTVVYDTGTNVDLAVQVIEEGVRIQTVLNDAAAPTEYRYELEGYTPVLLADGSVDLIASTQGRLQVRAGGIAAPWAFDANGVVVPTRYRVDGDTLVQEVDHTAGEYAYPIVADPTISLGWFVYINYSAADVKRYWSGTTFLNKAAAAAACGLIAGAPAAAVCGSISGDWFSSIGNTFATAKKQGRGVQIALTYVAYVPVQWKVV